MRFLEVSRWILSGGRSWVARDSFPPVPVSEPRQVRLRMNAFNHLKYTVSDHAVTMEVNGEIIDTAELPVYPAMGTVATVTAEEVFVKIVNFSENAEPVEITLDCGVEPEYTVGLLTGDAEAENSLEDPEYVHDVTLHLSGASSCFTYTAPPLSVNILKLTRKKD